MKQKIIIGNWKMTMPYTKAITFARNHFQKLNTFCTNKAQLVICPSFESLVPLISIAQETNIHIGAQNCSEHQKGAYTSQVSSLSLSNLGVTHCIIGHSEARVYLHETDKGIAQKLEQLFVHNITPIVCIGESLEEYRKENTKNIISEQLESILNIVKNYSDKNFYIAYEPIWAIGTGIIPPMKELTDIFSWLKNKCLHAQLLYGGSVHEQNINELKTIPHADGFLIGGASTDFQKLKKIVLSVIEE